MAAGGATDSDAEMRAFIGVNWRAYEDVWSKVKTSPRLQASRNFSAAVFTSCWLLYRRQYLLGFAVLGAFNATFLFGFYVWSPAELVLAWFFGRYGKSIVVLAGVTKIRDIGTLGLTADGARTRIRDSGGVDPLAAALGALAFGASAYWNLSQAVRQAEPAVGMLQSVLAIFPPH